MKNSHFISSSPWDIVRFAALIIIVEIISCSAAFVSTKAEPVRDAAIAYVQNETPSDVVITGINVTPYADGVHIIGDIIQSDGNMLVKVVSQCRSGAERMMRENILIYDFKTNKIVSDVTEQIRRI